MGLLSNITPESYYNGSADLFNFGPEYVKGKGNYQFTTLASVITAFMIAYVGEDKIFNKLSRTDVQFHAMRALQELTYDVLRSYKALEIEVPNTLQMVLPQDYVNYVKLVRVDSNGTERVLYPTGKTSNPFPIAQDSDGDYTFDASTLSTAGDITQQSPAGQSDTWQSYQNQSTVNTYTDDTTDLEIDNRGRRYGLDPQYAQSNGSFFIDRSLGKIHFSSTLSGKTITLKYISDGLGTDREMVVHKFCEEAMYKWIAYGILSTRSNVPEMIVQRFKKEKFAETRKAKIRLSNIKMEEFTQVLKGLSKPIK